MQLNPFFKLAKLASCLYAKAYFRILLFIIGGIIFNSCDIDNEPKSGSVTTDPKKEHPVAIKEDLNVSVDRLEIHKDGTGTYSRPGTAYYFSTNFVWDKNAQVNSTGVKAFGKYEGVGVDQIEGYSKNVSSGNYSITLKSDNIMTTFSNGTKIVEREDKKTYSNILTFTDTPYRKIYTDGKTADDAKEIFRRFSELNNEVIIISLSSNGYIVINGQKYFFPK